MARVPKHNMVELSKQTYKCIRSILAASIVHEGPAPKFFKPGVPATGQHAPGFLKSL